MLGSGDFSIDSVLEAASCFDFAHLLPVFRGQLT